MRIYKYRAVSVWLSISLTACGTQTDTTPEIFNTLSQSEFFTHNAAEFKCEDTVDYPTAKYQRLCFQLDEVTMTNLEEGQSIGLDMGLKIAAVFKDTGWESHTKNSNRFLYSKSLENGCVDKLFLDVDGMAEDDVINNNFPIQFAPLINFSKLRQPECAKT